MKTIQVIKLQIDLLALDVENLENDAKIEALEEIEKSIKTLKTTEITTTSQFSEVLKSNDSISLLQSEHEQIYSSKDKIQNQEISKVAEHKCNFCGKSFGLVDRHKLICRKSPEYLSRMFLCNECDYRSTTTKLMRDHKRKHSGQNQCPKCSYQAYSPKDLKMHQKNKSNCEKRLKKKENLFCTFCNYSTTVKTDLGFHMKDQNKNRQVNLPNETLEEIECSIIADKHKRS